MPARSKPKSAGRKQKPSKDGVKKKKRSRSAASAADAEESEELEISSTAKMPAFDGKRRADMSKAELDELNAYFMRKNRLRHSLEQKASDFATMLGGSVLLVVETGGGALRKGRRYITGSGRFSAEFLEADAKTIVEKGDLMWDEAATSSMFNLLTAASEGAAHSTSVAESAHEARRRKKKAIRRKKVEAKAGAKAKTKAEVEGEGEGEPSMDSAEETSMSDDGDE